MSAFAKVSQAAHGAINLKLGIIIKCAGDTLGLTIKDVACNGDGIATNIQKSAAANARHVADILRIAIKIAERPNNRPQDISDRHGRIGRPARCKPDEGLAPTAR